MKAILLSFITAAILAGCSNYGKKVSKEYLEVYYKDGITKEDAEKTLAHFYPLWKEKGDEISRKSIQLTKSGDTINFRMVSKMDVMDKIDPDIFYQTGNEISRYLFDNAPVNVELTDKNFKHIHTYVYRKNAGPGEKITVGNIEVYMEESYEKADANRLASFLQDYFAPANTISFKIGHDEGGFLLLKMVSSPEKAARVSDKDFYDVAALVSKTVYQGAPVIFQLTDHTFTPFKSFEYKTDADTFAE